MTSIADLRQNYTRSGLTETDLDSNPYQQFKKWFEEALAAKINEPNAMTLATVSKDGKPSARMVLLKGYDQRGFVFYTNYGSLKGQQLTENPTAALVFWWGELERQIRIEGQVEKVAATEADDYFQSRPHDSQLGAWVSNQSETIESRQVLEEKQEELRKKYAEKSIPRPDFWGGFRVIPNLIEFWQGRPSRLHDRLVYELVDSDWVIKRLSP